MKVESEKPDLKNNRTDLAVSLGKGLLGALPYVGPLVAEVIGAIIPNQRIERITRFLEILDVKVADLDQELVKAQFGSPGFVDLLEDSLYQAARALTDERKEYIASIVANSLSDEQIEYVQSKKLLSLLSLLNDIEVILLRAEVNESGLAISDDEFFERHKNVILATPATFGSSQGDVDKSIFRQSYRNHLLQLGLLQPVYRVKRGELPEFDHHTGTFKAKGHRITPLGKLLLKHINLITPRE